MSPYSRLAIAINIMFSCFFLSAQEKSIMTIEGNKIPSNSLERFIINKLDSLSIPALSIAIINNRNIAYYHNFGVKNIATKSNVDQKTLFEACSLSKPVFAYFMLKLVREGVFDLDVPLYQYAIDEQVDYSNPLFYKLLTAELPLTIVQAFQTEEIIMKLKCTSSFPQVHNLGILERAISI